ATSKVLRGNRGDRAAYACVRSHQAGVRVIRLTSAHGQRRNEVPAIVDVRDVRDIGHVHHVHAIEAASVPRIERIMRSYREPSDVAEPETRVVSKAYKEDECWRPHRAIVHIDRSRPPTPVPCVDEPTSIVIGGPSPRLIRHPGPSVVGLPYPASCLVRGPRGLLIRLPNRSVPWHVNPVAVSIQITRAGVIAIGPAPAFSLLELVVAVFVPAVP